MDDAHDIPDSTDWLNTPLKGFADLENALHCQICKEFYDTPMTTSCSHTFCSKCIRTSLSADGKCPACRTSDQASKLRNNWALQEVVATFLAARPAAISVARREQEQATRARRPGKRKRVLDSDDIAQAEADVRTTRSKSRRLAASQNSEAEAIEITDFEDDGDFEPEPEPQLQDGLVECPLGCGKRMKIEQVEPHLDRCEDEQKQEKRAKSRTPAGGFGSSRPSPRPSVKPQERLAELNYSLLKDNAMRKKLEDLGIPAWGSKQLLVRRHQEWVNVWNANCDSDRPRSKRELLQDLDTWERTQGGKAPTSHGTVSAVMRKDFDGTGWANKNKDEFSRLIADARRMKANPASAPSPPKDEESSHENSTKPVTNGDESSRPVFVQPRSEREPHSRDDTTSTNPSADNQEALASMQEKVEATNDGRESEPTDNAGFRSSDPRLERLEALESNGDARLASRRPSDPLSGVESAALLDLNHFGNPRAGSQDQPMMHEKTGSVCNLPAHVHSSPRKLPMFTVPEGPITDVDGDGPAVQ